MTILSKSVIRGKNSHPEEVRHESVESDEGSRGISEKIIHQPVLLKEVLKYLNPQSGENFVDCTVGLGGHSFAILEKTGPDGKVLGLDLDNKSLEILKEKGNERLILAQANFSDLKKAAKENNFISINGILLDLGISSWQIEQSSRGFSFQGSEPLDMRLDPSNNDLTAREIINNWPEGRLVEIFRDYGGERFSRRIARQIVNSRKSKAIETTDQLVGLIIRAYPRRRVRRIHPATKIFQALRIAVNDELENLRKALPEATDILMPQGRIVVISFHSLEDKIVKNFFREKAKEGYLRILTKKPVGPTIEEITLNRRSRSAKLRAAIKL